VWVLFFFFFCVAHSLGPQSIPIHPSIHSFCISFSEKSNHHPTNTHKLRPPPLPSTVDGPYVGLHSADLVRGACLVEHGGAFPDVSAVLTRPVDRICWRCLADPASPFPRRRPRAPVAGRLEPLCRGEEGGPVCHALVSGAPRFWCW
jgi:hypothetical protein